MKGDTSGGAGTANSFALYMFGGVIQFELYNADGTDAKGIADSVFGTVPTNAETYGLVRVDGVAKTINLNINGLGWNTPVSFTGTPGNAGSLQVAAQGNASPQNRFNGSIGPVVIQTGGTQLSSWETAMLAYV